MVVDTLGHLSALKVTHSDAQQGAHVGELAAETQLVSDDSIVLAFVD
jgi:hypothetical protein